MVVVTVAEDECLHLGQINTHDCDVVFQCVDGITEVEHQIAGLSAGLRLQGQGKAPLVVQRLAIVAWRRQPGTLDLHPGRTAGARCVVAAVDEHLDRQPIDHRDGQGRGRLRQCRANTEPRGGECNRAQEKTSTLDACSHNDLPASEYQRTLQLRLEFRVTGPHVKVVGCFSKRHEILPTCIFSRPGNCPGARSMPSAGIAQLVERNLSKVEVAVSNPASRSNSLGATSTCDQFRARSLTRDAAQQSAGKTCSLDTPPASTRRNRRRLRRIRRSARRIGVTFTGRLERPCRPDTA